MFCAPETPSTADTGKDCLDLFTRLTCCQSLLESDDAKASAIFSRLMNCYTSALRRLTSYLYLNLADFLSWWRTPAEGQPAWFHTSCQKLAFSFKRRAWEFQPATAEDLRTVGRDLEAAQSLRQSVNCIQNSSSKAWCCVHKGSLQPLTPSGNDGRCSVTKEQ